MRLLLTLLVIFVAIVALGFWTNHLLKVSTEEMLGSIEQVTWGIENGHWDVAYDQTVQLEKTWDEKAKWWPTVLDHQEIDNIEFAMARAKEYVATRDTALSRGELSELGLMLKHIPEKESVRLRNIL